MPIYEYICSDCHGRFQKLSSSFSAPANLACPRCQSANVRKAISRFAVMQNEEARLEAMADPSVFNGLDENDPVAVSRWAKKMGQMMGEDVGEDWDQTVDEMLEEEFSGDKKNTAEKSEDLGWG